MKEMASGLYAWEGEFPEDGTMPCLVADLRTKVVRYAAPGSLGKAEDEEAAMRVIWPSVKHGEWLGVSWQYIGLQMKREYESLRAADLANRQSQRIRAAEFRRQHRLWCALSLLTLGIYALFVSAPQMDYTKVVVCEADHLVTVVPVYGPESIVNGVRRLLNQGLVKLKKEGDLEVLFPTPALVKAIAQV